MKVIPFPGAAQKCKRTKPRVEKSNNPMDCLITESFAFTCHKCKHGTSFKQEGMIFRIIEFYCSKCGTKHKVSNPAFVKE